MMDTRTGQAQRRFREIPEKYANLSEYQESDGTVRHRCFLSYHAEDAPAVLPMFKDANQFLFRAS